MARTKQTPTDKKPSNKMSNVNKSRIKETSRRGATKGKVTENTNSTHENNNDVNVGGLKQVIGDGPGCNLCFPYVQCTDGMRDVCRLMISGREKLSRENLHELRRSQQELEEAAARKRKNKKEVPSPSCKQNNVLQSPSQPSTSTDVRFNSGPKRGQRLCKTCNEPIESEFDQDKITHRGRRNRRGGGSIPDSDECYMCRKRRSYFKKYSKHSQSENSNSLLNDSTKNLSKLWKEWLEAKLQATSESSSESSEEEDLNSSVVESKNSLSNTDHFVILSEDEASGSGASSCYVVEPMELETTQQENKSKNNIYDASTCDESSDEENGKEIQKKDVQKEPLEAQNSTVDSNTANEDTIMEVVTEMTTELEQHSPQSSDFTLEYHDDLSQNPPSVNPNTEQLEEPDSQTEASNAEDKNFDWRDKNPHHLAKNLYLLNHQLYTDCNISVQDGVDNIEEFKCHKFILVLASQVFADMLFGSDNQPASDQIELKNVSPKSFKHLLKFVYGNQFDLQNIEDVLAVWELAHTYKISSLVCKCKNFVQASINPQNICLLLSFKHITPTFRNICLRVWRNETPQVLDSAGFLACELNLLQELLSKTELNIESELVLIQACERWAEQRINDNQSMIDVLGTARQQLRFLTLSSAKFAEGPAKSNLLTLEEKLDLFVALATPSEQRILRNGLSNEQESRINPLHEQ